MSATLWAPRLVLPVSAERDHIRGSANAPLVLVVQAITSARIAGRRIW